MSKTSRRVSTFIFAFMAFVLVAGAIAPVFQRNVAQTTQTLPATPVPTPTFPAPISDLDAISFSQRYLHPTGLFSVAQPAGWEPSAPVSEADRASITMVNSDQLSVIETSVESFANPVASLDELSARFDETYLDSSWARYGAWEETARRQEDGRLVIDFNLTLNRQQYVARQLSWADGSWVYNTRVVAPFTATSMLVHVINNLADSLDANTMFAGQPVAWQMYYDPVSQHIARFPESWVVEDSAPGQPASIVGPDGSALRLEAVAGAVTSAEDAEAWVLSGRPNATITSIEPAAQGDAEGFSVAYTYATPDGDRASGLALLLNGPDDMLHAANLQFPAGDVDLNAVAPAEATPEATAEAGAAPSEYATLKDIVETFYLLPAQNYTNIVAPTPLPPAPAASADATPEVEVTPDAG